MMVLSNFSSIVQLKVLLQLMHAFFSHSLKKHLEFQKLCEVFTKRRNKLFMNVKTMDKYVFFIKCVMEQYPHLIARYMLMFPRVTLPMKA
jgi:hypothetical protein